jgi:membrane protein
MLPDTTEPRAGGHNLEARRGFNEILSAKSAGVEPPHSWWHPVKRLWALINRTNLSFLASAVAFYAMLSLFPGLAVVLSAYGLFADPITVEHQISLLQGLFPQEVMGLLSDQLHAIAQKNNSELGLGVVVGLVLALWSSRAASSALMTALNIIYAQHEHRGFFVQQGIAIALTLAGATFGIVALTLVAVTPVIVNLIPDFVFLDGTAAQIRRVLALVRWPILAVLISVGFALIYRFAPSRKEPNWLLIALGSVVGTVLWLLGSALFSIYVSSFGSYDRVYGSLGAVIVLLMWFYVSAVALLLGAAIDAEMEHWNRPRRRE